MPIKKVSRDQLEDRREIIRGLLARGITTPGRIYNQKQLRPIYSIYKNPYDVILNDIKVVRKENKKNGLAQEVQESLGEYIARIEEQLQECWTNYPKLNDNAKVGMMRVIRDLSRELAIAKGVDPDTVDSSQFKININNSPTIEERGKVEVSENDLKEIGDILVKGRRNRVYSGESKEDSKGE